jgi:hypothetical protein
MSALHVHLHGVAVIHFYKAVSEKLVSCTFRLDYQLLVKSKKINNGNYSCTGENQNTFMKILKRCLIVMKKTSAHSKCLLVVEHNPRTRNATDVINDVN